MPGRHKLLILISAIILIPLLLGMIPLNMAHRLASGGPFTHCKQAQWSNYCPFNSAISHVDHTIVSLNSTRLDQESMFSFDFQVLLLDFANSNTSVNSVPLRC